MSAVVDYQPGESFVHKLHPLTKMAWALAVLILSLLYTDYRFAAAVLLFVLGTALIGGVLPALSRVLKGLVVFAFILFLIQVFFYDDGKVFFYVLPVGPGYLPVTDRGISLGIAIGIRMLTIVTSFLVVLATTRTRDIMVALVEKVKIPGDIAFMILTAIRFIPTFLNDLKQISDAQKARALVLEGWNPARKIKAYIPLAIPLVLMSLKKAQQMVLAMETRGYGIGPRSHLYELKTGAGDAGTLVLLACLVALGVVLRIKGMGI